MEANAVAEPRRTPTTLQKVVWGLAGCVLVGIGAVGIVLPGLPTTVFLILACLCFGRSYPEAVAWIRSRPLFLPYFRYFEDNGFTRRARIAALTAMWTMSTISVVILVSVSPFVAAGVVGLAAIGTGAILLWP